LPEKDERIFLDPAPNVVIMQFSSSSIDMQLSFWLKNITDLAAVKSKILLAIDIAFKENAIKIPFPRQELHISSFTNEEIYNKNESEKK
jgi:small-conductance mechanosensitive channel